MEEQVVNQFREYITEHRDNLLTWLESDTTHKDLQLGDTSPEEVTQVVSKHNEVLNRIDCDEFGTCRECGGEVEPERLELDFTTCVCLDHYSEEQIRGLERDLELAAKVQRQLLPYQVPVLPGVQIAAHTEPAQVVGGDYFDFFSYPDGAQGAIIADVMGKGLSASMLMSNLQASLRILGPEYLHLDELAGRLNQLFRYNMKLVSFISMFLVRLDMEAGRIQYCNAGHNPAVWWDASARTIHLLKPTGPAIGLTGSAKFKSMELRFGPGDLLLLYTDGLVEAHNSEDIEFGKERVTTYVKKHLHQPLNLFLTGLRETAKEFAGKFDDDVTLMVIRIQE
jgi:sigma-B regulation protein RsbU (phosphoserine phosphatase)